MSARTYTLQIASALVLTIAALWAATQWAAAMLGYQAALGAPWVDLLGLKVYAPWKLFVWWLAFDAQAPDVFARAGAVAAFGGLASGAVAIGGAARRASLKQASHNLRLGPLGGRFRRARRHGCWATAASCSGSIEDRYLRHDGPEHVLAVAPTRSGKGVGLVLPTLLTWPGSAVIHDIKGENWAADRRLALAASRTACCSIRPIPCRPASIRCSRCARARTRCATCRTSPTSWSIRKAPGSGAITGRRPRTRC